MAKVFGLTLSTMLFALCASVEAQQPKKIPWIGYLSLAAKPGARDQAFKRDLHELGWIDGQNITIEYRWLRTSRIACLP